MKVESVRTITGPSVYSYQPVIVARLDLERLKDQRSCEAADFNGRLLEKFPGLREHFCQRGRVSGFVERLEEGTHFNHVIEHIAVEMLAQAGLGRRDEKLCRADERDSSRAVIETTVVEAARFLLPVAAEIAEAILEEKSYAFEEKIAEAKRIAANAELAPRGRAIVEAAEKRGIPWTRAEENNSLQLGYGRNLHFVQTATIDQTSGSAAKSLSDKDETERRDAGGAVIEMLYPEGAPSRIPIVAITGTNGKTTVTRMTAHILLESGLNVGAATTDGILFNGETIFSGDTTGPASAKKILGDKAVDIAVLETARGGILRRGLGWDWADVGVVTNITEDHIGQDGIESVADLVNVKALVAERVRENGTLVLNADDAESANLVNRPKVRQIKKKIIYFALSEENPIIKKHSETGETVYFARDNWICERRRAGEILPIVKTTAILVTMSGAADFQIQNAMAAIAVARALGLSSEKIAKALGAFRGEAHNPGRNNLYRVGMGYVLVDYGHNTDGFAAVCRMARRWTGKTVTAIIGLPGDRDNRIIEEAARVAARGFDRVIVTEEVNPRGRAPGEMAKLLCDAIGRENPGGNCEIVPDEIEAFSKALAEMRENEVVVIFYRQLNLILEILAENRAVPVSSFDKTSASAKMKIQV